MTAVEWADPKADPPPPDALRGRDAVVHLLGEPVAQRWSDSAKNEIRESRVLATRNLVAGIAELAEGDRPAVLVSQSATGYYGPRGDERVDESAPAGGDFLAEVCVAWEAEAHDAEDLGLRVAITRTGVVMAEDGGALEKMLPPFKLGVGGPVAGGKQYVPWIHTDDVVGALAVLPRHPGRERAAQPRRPRARDQQGALQGARAGARASRGGARCPASRSSCSTARWRRS